MQRYDGTIAVWYSTHYQVDTRDWDNIKEFGNPHNPKLGFYDSADPEIIRQHLQWMRRAGIDLIIYDVFSSGKWDLTDLPKDKALAELVRQLDQQEGERPIKLAIWLEKYLSNPTLEEYEFAMEYVREHFVHKDWYFHYQGKPLVVPYLNGDCGPIDAIEWKYGPEFSIHRIRPYKSDVWAYIEHSPQMPRRDWMSAAPGFDASLENLHIAHHHPQHKQANPDNAQIREAASKTDREEGAFFRRQLEWAQKHAPEIIFVSGWNDWQYGNQIEPANEYGFLYLDVLAEATGRQGETARYRNEK